MNNVQLIGRLAADPEVTETPNGRKVANFRVVTSHKYVKDGEEKEVPEYHRIVAWGVQAHSAATFKKGQTIMVFGRLQTRSWELDMNVKQYRTEIVAEFLFATAADTAPSS